MRPRVPMRWLFASSQARAAARSPVAAGVDQDDADAGSATGVTVTAVRRPAAA